MLKGYLKEPQKLTEEKNQEGEARRRAGIAWPALLCSITVARQPGVVAGLLLCYCSYTA